MKKIGKDEFIRRINVRYPSESFNVLQYESLGKPAIIQCNTCGEQISITKASNFFVKTKAFGCKNCHGLWREREKKIQTIQKFYDIIKVEVKESHKYYTVRCKLCSHIRQDSLNNLIKHLQCGCITGVKRNRSAEEFISEVNKNSCIGPYSLIGEYKNQTHKVLLRHVCGFIWEVRPADVIKGRSICPKCGKKQSKACLYIENIFKEHNIPIQIEKRLNESLQRFDFYLEKDDLKIAIEYHGEQHYKEIPFFSQTLEEQQCRDQTKREYCKQHNIILYEIPYTFSNEEIHNQILLIINKFNDYSTRKQIISD